MPDLMASSKLFVEDALISVTRAIDIFEFSFLYYLLIVAAIGGQKAVSKGSKFIFS
jgi:hypothetical protein